MVTNASSIDVEKAITDASARRPRRMKVLGNVSDDASCPTVSEITTIGPSTTDPAGTSITVTSPAEACARTAKGSSTSCKSSPRPSKTCSCVRSELMFKLSFSVRAPSFTSTR